MANPLYSISKTSFLKFEQCRKAFFLYKNHPYLRDKISIDKQLTFKRGHDVGFFAQQLFPGGTDVSKLIKNSSEGIAVTKTLIENQTPVIYEATFVHNGVLIMIDILCLVEGKYYAYEVKSSLKVSDNYIKDACLQYYVTKNNLPALEDFFLVTLNADYVLSGEVEPKKLFKKRSVKQRAEENFIFFEQRLNEAHAVLEQNVIPNIEIGKHCFRPYPCDYLGSCWKETLTEKSVFNLPVIDKSRLFEWHESGIRNIDQLQDEFLEKEVYKKIKKAFVEKTPIIDHVKINAFLAKIKQPAAAMDMEIWSPAIPQINGTRPFEQVPFLVCFYSEHESRHFFTANVPDGRKEFAEQLISLSAVYQSILVYDKTLELSIIENLAKIFPEYRASLDELKAKFLDVFDIFLGLSYYHPDFQNNFSLKTASQFLLKDVTYPKISSGLEAMNFYEQFRLEQNQLQKETIKNDLVAYCDTDTLATFKLVDFFKNLNPALVK